MGQESDGGALRPLSPVQTDPSPSVPLAPVYVLVEYGLWPFPIQDRDRANDVTDEQITEWI